MTSSAAHASGLAKTAAGEAADLETARWLDILHVTPLYHPSDGGAERHVRRVSEGLAARGHRVTVLTQNAENARALSGRVAGSLPATETLNSVEVVRLSPASGALALLLDAVTRVPGGYRLSSALLTEDVVQLLHAFPRNLAFIRRILGASADVVGAWNWHWPLAFHVYAACRIKRCRLVGIPLFHTAEPWSERDVHGRMIRACDGLILNTGHEEDFISARWPGELPPMCVAGVGIDPDDFEQADGGAFRRSHDLGEDLVVGFVGRMIPSKGVHRVVEAMTRVWAWREDVRLVLAGMRTTPFPLLDELLASLDPEQRGRILVVADFPESRKTDLLDAVDLLVLPSTGESFGIAYLEAWMRSKPVIGARVGSTPRVVQDGQDGLLVNPNDPEEIGQAVVSLLADPERREAMGRRGREKTMERHTWERVIDRIERFYRARTARAPRLAAPGGRSRPT